MLSPIRENKETYSDTPGESPGEHMSSDGSDEDFPLVGVRRHRARPSRFSLANTLCMGVFTVSLIAVGFLMGVIGTTILYRRSLSVLNNVQGGRLGSFEAGFATEFASAAAAIEIQTKQFTSGLEWDEDGVLYRTFNHDEKTYVGPPSAEIDEAWETLVRGRYIAVTPEEADVIGGGIYLNPVEGLHRAGVSVLHTLHCLNVIRQALHPQYYPAKNPHNQRLHVDHCIDHIRQYIQCHGDLTPLPVQWAESANTTNAAFEIVHTCRNFDKIRLWATDRDTEVKRIIRLGQ